MPQPTDRKDLRSHLRKARLAGAVLQKATEELRSAIALALDLAQDSRFDGAEAEEVRTAQRELAEAKSAIDRSDVNAAIEAVESANRLLSAIADNERTTHLM